MNKLTIIGNLTRDPELRSVNGRDGAVSVCDFTVAVNRRQTSQQRANGQQQEADYFRVTAWRALGENAAKFLAKGRKVCVIGPVSVRTYQAQDGTTRSSLEVQADEIEFLTPRGEGNAATGGYTAPGGYATPAAAAPAPAPVPTPAPHQMGFTEVEVDDLPF